MNNTISIHPRTQGDAIFLAGQQALDALTRGVQQTRMPECEASADIFRHEQLIEYGKLVRSCIYRIPYTNSCAALDCFTPQPETLFRQLGLRTLDTRTNPFISFQ